MQKKVIALAIAGLFSGAAFAQSANVTLYGVADVGVVVDNSGYGNKVGVTSGGGNTSRIGLKGSEDLGNGLSAIFTLESGVQLDTGVTGGGAVAPGLNKAQVSSGFGGQYINNAGTGGAVWSRQAWAGLSSKTLGTLTFGKQYSPMVPVYYAIDTFSFATAGTMFSAMAYIPGYTTRPNNAAKYVSPKFFNGWQVEAMLTSGTENNVQGDDQALGVSDKAGRLSGLNVFYSQGPLNLGLAYHNNNGNNPITAVQSKVISSQGWVLGGNYDFGMLKLYAGYGRGKERDRAVALVALPLIPAEANAWHIGINVPAGRGNVLLGYSKLNDKTYNLPGANFKAWALGYRYPLSKRTMLYTTYTKGDNDTNATRPLLSAGDTAALVTPAKAGFDPSRWDFGMSHSF
ncbi:MAG: porin [Betaproteobacteria bacterium]|nr:MAG: porin [Betaproteobacteria bacterium]